MKSNSKENMNEKLMPDYMHWSVRYEIQILNTNSKL